MSWIKQIEHWATERADKIAVVCGKEKISYKMLIDKTTCLAVKIVNLKKVDAQIPIVIVCNRGIGFIIAILASIRSGNYYVPIETPYPLERIKNILHQFDNYIVITQANLLQFFEDRNNIICIDEQEETQSTEFLAPLDYKKNPLCYCIFTSGTTGMPKGVLISHQNVDNLINGFLATIYSKIDITVNVGVLSNFSFDASVKQIFGALFWGHTLVIAKREERMFPNKLQKYLEQQNIYIVDGTPSIYQLLIKKEKKNDINVKIFLIGGEVMHWSFLNRFYDYLGYNPVVINVYGPSECCVDASAYWIYGKVLNYVNDIVPIGKPIANTCFFIKESTEGDSEKGELIIAGKLVGEGYVNYKSASFSYDDKFGKIYKTGDIVYRDSENNYVIVGRTDDQIKINGNRIELAELENVISNITGGEVVACYLKESVESIYVFVYAQEGVAFDEVVVKKKVKDLLPSYAIPRKIFFLRQNFPITDNGKIDKKKLLDEYVKR